MKVSSVKFSSAPIVTLLTMAFHVVPRLRIGMMIGMTLTASMTVVVFFGTVIVLNLGRAFLIGR